jgi:monooxygenase
MIRSAQERHLPPGYDLDTHFTPRYNPWDQRLCLAPDGDLFAALRDGRASVVTDQIEEVTPHGLRLRGGRTLDADILVLATGLTMQLLGGLELVVDGRPVDLARTLVYRGMMLSGVPNLALTIGYTNASWTLKADLTSEYVCRLLRHMRVRGYRQCVPVARGPVQPRPLMDFSAGYVRRSLDSLPKSGSRKPWRLGMSYAHDVVALRYGRIDDGVLRFTRHRAPTVGR